jgi:3-oxoacyl-[acyl-carrier-protein] synthase II
MNYASGVAVTGIGIVTPFGGTDALLDGLMECRSCLEPLAIFESDINPAPTVGQIRKLPDVEDRFGSRLSRTDKLSIIASQRALDHAALAQTDAARSGVVIATTIGGISELSPQISKDPRAYYRRNGFPISYQRGHAADVVSSFLGSKGPRLGISTACASGSMALAIAARMILSGSASVMLAGGGEALCWFSLSGFNSLQALDPGLCRPFDQERNGLNVGEGAAMLVLEDLQHARDRKAEVLAVLRGWGMSNDAYHLTAPDENGRGLAESMRIALSMAGVKADQIGYVNAHGTGTYLNDVAEVKAYESAFESCSKRIPVSSSKSYFGHCLGAAGALEAAVSILSLRHGVLFPTLRLKNPIESPRIDWIMDGIRHTPVSLAISASAGFGGSNTSLVFGLC